MKWKQSCDEKSKLLNTVTESKDGPTIKLVEDDKKRHEKILEKRISHGSDIVTQIKEKKFASKKQKD
jgi:hypothetical protein